jgi:biopolymer transport protein ExbB
MRRICGRTMSVAWVGCLVALAACAALGETNAVTAAETGRLAQHVSLGELFDKGGVLMYPLAVMSVIGVAFVVYFFVVLRRDLVAPDLLRRDVVSKVEQGLTDDARTACSYRPCPFSEIAVAALDHAGSVGRVDAALLKDVIEGEGARQAAVLQGQIQYLLDVAVIAPMIGLLGTVFGMMRAFNVVAFDLAKAKPMLLAAGVAEALITTAGGLIIGIPAMIFYAYFRGRSSRLVADLEAASAQLMNAMLRNKGA